MTKPVPTFDHVVVNTRDQLDAAEAAYRRLGFTLTPRGFHTLGSANHLAIFGTDYLELIGILNPDSARRDVMNAPTGLNGLVFATEDSTALHAALTAAGLAATPPMQFSRPVDLGTETRDATFRTVHLTPQPVWPGRLYFCHHLTRDLVWRDEWRHHANGAIAVARTLIASDNPARLGATFAAAFGAVRDIPGGIRLAAGLGNVDVLTHAEVAAQLGAAARPDDRPEYMAALTLRTASLDSTRTALAAVPTLDEPTRIRVPAAEAFGCVLEFIE